MNSFNETDSDELNKSESDYEFDKRDEITKMISDNEERKKWKKNIILITIGKIERTK
jgi:hypothetical protein